jgi:uncharacterized RDD family membrane protein YckC
MNWYYAKEGQQTGPVDEAALNDLVRTGVIREDTLVWREGMPSWQPYATARGTVGVAVPAGTVPAVPLPAAHHYGGFWIRFVARVIDGLLVGLLQGVLVFPLLLMFGGMGRLLGGLENGEEAAMAAIPAMMGMVMMFTVVGIGVGLAYEVYFLSTRAATPGKMALGLKVIRPDGQRISGGLAAGRFFARWLSDLVLYIGDIIAALDAEKRSLHDHICGTRVIYSK